MAKSDYKIKGGKSKIIINPDKEKLKEAVMRAREKAREAILKNKYDDTSMKADMKTRYGSEKGEQIYYATIRKKAMSKKDKMEQVEFAGNYEGPLYAPHPDLAELEEDSRRMSNKQHTKRVRANIKAFGSNFTPPNNWDPDANRGQGEVVTRKQMEKKRRKSLRQEEVELDEATRAAKEGKKDEHRVGVDIRAKQSAATLAAKRSRQKVLDAYEKKTGKKLDIGKTPEGKKHSQHFGGSRQEKKVKGAKETPAETHNRRVGRQVSRVVKHGYTSKEKKEVESMAKHTSARD